MRYPVFPVLMTHVLPLIGTLCVRSTDTVKKRHYKAKILDHVDMTAD